jgi:eukaryotic-like serine/threonine-protein kinase
MDKSSSRYRIIREIGRGAFGVVLLAHDNRLDRKVALKALTIPEGLSSEEHKQLIDRFYREARAAAGLSHPNIVTVHDISKARDWHFISMEYLDGQALSDVVVRGPMEYDRALKIAEQILDGLGYAHSRDVVHRDVKPENIFLMGGDKVKIVDFGLARVLTTTTITKSGVVVGTPGYISPEIIRGKPTGPWSDVFSFGVTFYEVLTGKRPFGPETAFDTYVNVIYRIISEDPEPPSSINPSVPRAIDSVVLKCLAKDPADRYRRVEAIRTHLSAIEAGKKLPGGVDALDAASATRGVSALEEALLEGTAVGLEETPLPREAPEGVTSGEVQVSPTRTPFVIRPKAGEEEPEEVRRVEPPVPAAGVPAAQVDAQAARAPVARPAPAMQTPRAAIRRRVIPWKWVGVAAAGVAGLFIALFFLGILPGKSSGVKCPDLKGKTVSEAEEELRQAGLELGKREESFSDETEKGRIAEQSPESGKSVSKGEGVDVVVSKGSDSITIPDAANKSEQEATSELEGLGLAVNRAEDSSDTVPSGHVIYQDPQPGTEAANGSAVTIVISTGARQAAQPETPPVTPTTQPSEPTGPDYVACPTCGGAGNVTCSSCGGSGSVTRSAACPRCGGSGVDPDGGVCTQCGGSGSITSTSSCTTCGGSGRVTCPRCGGSGRVQAMLIRIMARRYSLRPTGRIAI